MDSLKFTDDLQQRYPCLANVLNRVSTKKDKDLQVDVCEHEEMKQAWLKYEVIYQSVRQMINEKCAEILKGSLSAEETMFWESFEKAFQALELLACSNFDKTILGVDRSSIEAFVSQQKANWDNKLSEDLKEMLSQHLKCICMNLTEYYDGIDYSKRTGVLRSRAINLHEVIANDKDQLEQTQKELKETKEKAINCFIQNIQLLCSCSIPLDQMMNKYQLKLQKKKDRLDIEKLSSELQMTILKAKSRRVQLMSETYSKENVTCLKKIRQTLDDKISAGNGELQATEEKLCAYRSLGPEFKCIVDEYSKTEAELTKQKWILSEIEKQTASRKSKC